MAYDKEMSQDPNNSKETQQQQQQQIQPQQQWQWQQQCWDTTTNLVDYDNNGSVDKDENESTLWMTMTMTRQRWEITTTTTTTTTITTTTARQKNQSCGQCWQWRQCKQRWKQGQWPAGRWGGEANVTQYILQCLPGRSRRSDSVSRGRQELVNYNDNDNHVDKYENKPTLWITNDKNND